MPAIRLREITHLALSAPRQTGEAVGAATFETIVIDRRGGDTKQLSPGQRGAGIAAGEPVQKVALRRMRRGKFFKITLAKPAAGEI